MPSDLKQLLDQHAALYNQTSFIDTDPIRIPHRFSQLADIEITAFWVAMLAWGQRQTIINKANELIELMDGAPHQFIRDHQEKDRERFSNFKHRTFNYTDTLYFLEFLQQYYRQHQSLEDAFARHITSESPHVGPALSGFHELFFSLPDAPHRTRKHIATPLRKSSCKRLNMFLRWMVRQDDTGVDFGLWKRIAPHQLLIPLDVHVDRVARHFGLLKRKQTDWLAVLELTEQLRQFDPSDPVKYDFALFGMGVLQYDQFKK
ncbi:MAG: TIGR02757 family protein [Saprospiraceae bacterium]|nr:MAG: TIGR02757 family protein [Saprospiraceae bacterium]